MNRPLLIHGEDHAQLEALGRTVAGRLQASFHDEFGEEAGSVAGRVYEGVTIRKSEALLDREGRVELLSKAIVVALANERGFSQGGLDAPRIPTWMRSLEPLLAREMVEAHAVIVATDAPEDVAEEIVGLARREPVVVAARERSYLVEVGAGIVRDCLARLNFGAPVMLYLTDENVEGLHGAWLGEALEATGLRVVRHVLRPGEEAKRLETLGEIFDRALASGIDRSSWLVAAGGGVTTDIGGLVAALWMRGVRWIGIPTTLLAMVDASVGGKTAVDHGVGKNAVGAFWQPSRVICDVEFLRTEGDRNYVGALSEVVKTAIIGDPGLFEILEENVESILRRDLGLMREVVHRCVQVKARVVGLDERESGLRAVLNLGHTVGHALEALGEYRRYTHGEAVSLGMVVALRLGVVLGHTPRNCAERVVTLLGRLGLPVEVNATELAECTELLGHDKKRSGSAIRFVFARGLGDVVTERIALEDLRQVVRGLGLGQG